MRQIKFRCWSKNDKKFLSADRPTHHFFIRKDHKFTYHYLQFNEKLFDLQQFTGLLDKNGKEIYEGDYVKFPNFSPSHETSEFKISEVFWYDDEAGFFVGSRSKMISPIQISSIIEDIEIIGNIYENPELLNNKQ